MSELAYRHDEHHPLLEGYLERAVATPPFTLDRLPAHLCLDVAAGDEMFLHALDQCHQHRGAALVSWARSGFEGARIVLELLAAWFDDASSRSVLDFASGHGRVTRFLATRLSVNRLSAADISEPAVAFLRQHLGIDAFASSHEGRRFSRLRSGRSWDLVLAFSLFSHLPERRFREWLEALASSVEPGGLLVFSTLGPGARLGRPPLTRCSYEFERISESALELDEYGTAWVTEAWVREGLAGAGLDAHSALVAPAGLWGLQDLWIVPVGSSEKAAERLESARTALSLPPAAAVDAVRPVAPNRLAVEGWAVERVWTPEGVRLQPCSVDVSVVRAGTRLARAQRPADLERDDVAQALQNGPPPCGFRLDLDAPTPLRHDDLLLITSLDDDGRAGAPFHASFVEGADLVARVSGVRRDAEARAQELQRRISAMELSRFWRLRQRWFALKRGLGLTDER